MSYTARAHFLPAGLPAGYRLVTKEAVTHPDNGQSGALLQVLATGLYVLYSAGVTISVPQDFARKLDQGEVE